MHKENIPDYNWQGHNFDTFSYIKTDTLGLPYDQGSIMHYEMASMAMEGGYLAMTPRESIYEHSVGSGNRMSFRDVLMVNKWYCMGELVLVRGDHQGIQPIHMSREFRPLLRVGSQPVWLWPGGWEGLC